jgi:hypothetical protein
MKIIKLFLSRTEGIPLLMVLTLLFPGILKAQTETVAPPDAKVIPWIGVWEAVETPISQPGKAPEAKALLEIRPTAGGKGFDISSKTSTKLVNEIVLPDGMQRSMDSKNCKGLQSYNWESQTGILLGSSQITCKDSAPYNVSNLKMMVSDNRMVDILVIKSSEQTRLAIRHFEFQSDLPDYQGYSSAREVTAMRTSLAAPWDLNKIIYLSKVIDVPILEAALLEKNTPLKVTTKSLKQMNAAKVPKPIIDLILAMAIPDKFNIRKSGRIAVASAATSAGNSYPYYLASPYPDFYDRYYGFAGRYPWSDYYWSYGSPFWWNYPIYINVPSGGGNPGGSGGGGGGGGTGQPNPYSDGRLSSGSGYIQVTPRDTGHQAVPRNGYATPSVGRSSGYSAPPSSSGMSSSVNSSSGGGYSNPSSSGGGYSNPSSSGGSSSAPSASPSGYSSGGSSSGQAVPRQ